MHNYIQELRNKPDHHKKRVALGGAFVVTAAMFLAWVSVIFPSNTNQIIADSKASQAASSQTASAQTPFQDLKDNVASAVTSIKSLFEQKSTDLNFQNEYTKMKDQVQSGEIKLTPNASQSNDTDNSNSNTYSATN